MSTDHVVGMYTFGSFREFVTDPCSLEEARQFVAAPPPPWVPRSQDSLEIFELYRVEDEEIPA